ncbi:glycosyltransferase [Sulfuracidifex metallicus]|uniref:Glycosyltransferase n=1 Tax=Sulfuracidifex metallicus DSM 6482 = JCM 9184 TaxID=523847 RepID=A0A6A9QTQ2_SULME|nr:glycosyltransferase [Sulfuracidifex metallicus]MUN28522.1 glycosyltransferase [Sulfuracidifex metallicus DSM 6482 = JCM 9184]WOE50941.1 glycosyltransferase [Sulfuracidifex metallicus DSM 6482 = JCM 9184]
MASICVYGTVFNIVNTFEDSVKFVWSPDYDIVIVDNYSKDGTWEKLQELKKEYNLKLLRLKSSRGKGRAYALEQCPENSITAYFDLDVMYNQNYHKVIKSGLKELFIVGPVMSYINSKEDILKPGNWRDLNFGEDIEFLSRQNISITFPLIIGKNEDVTTKNLYIEREKRYSKFWKIRILKNYRYI